MTSGLTYYTRRAESLQPGHAFTYRGRSGIVSAIMKDEEGIHITYTDPSLDGAELTFRLSPRSNVQVQTFRL